MKIAMYIRVSTKKQDHELQEKELRAFAHGRGWDDFKIYREKETATHTDRPEFKRLMNDVRAGSIDVVLVWKLDRMFRSLKDAVNHMHEIGEYDVLFAALKDAVDMTTPAGRLMIHMIAAFAEFEAELIRERVRAGMKHAQEKGTKSGKPIGRPSTYREVDHDAVKALHKGGQGPTAIAKYLKIGRATVYRILKAA